jgi:hypothetical protein
MKYEINERIAIRKSRTTLQKCVHCGQFMQKDEVAVCLSNKGDKLSIQKNLWLHIRCAVPMAKSIMKASQDPAFGAELI